MKVQTHNDKEIDINGTCLQGYIHTTYDRLVSVLGKPHSGDEYKIDAEWDIEFPNGKVATVYNYKTGKNYNGDEGQETKHITDWHIGGNDPEVVGLVQALIGGSAMSAYS